MMRFLITLLGMCLLSANGSAQGKKVTVKWYGHSFFQVVSSAGTKVVFDPHAIEEYGTPTVSADLVLISHPHEDHAQVGVLANRAQAKVLHAVVGEGNRQTWSAVDEKFKDVNVRTLPRSVGTYHDSEQGKKRGKNGVWIAEIDGLTFVHLGDLGHELTTEQVKAIGNVDVLFIPIGGIYTINGGEAKKVIEQLKPKLYIFPMHYATKVYDYVAKPDEFLEDQENVRKVPNTNEFTFNNDLKLAAPELVMLGWTK